MNSNIFSLSLKVLLCACLAVLAACDNSVRNNTGAVPNIDITGRVNLGLVRYAKVQLVGIDQYGQPQKQTADDYFGDTYRTDEQGRFNAQIQGAYAGSLMVIVSQDDYDVVTQAATETSPAVTVSRKTQIRCAVKSGCIDDDLGAVAYGDWFDAPEEFELWAAIPDVQGAENGLELNVSLLTHLAAKLAYSNYISDGGSSCTNGAGNCPVQDLVNDIFTPQSIFEANSRVQKQFTNGTAAAVYSEPWSVFDSSVNSADTVEGLSQVLHGIASVHWLQRAKSQNTSLMATMAEFEAAYLNAANQGQLLGTDPAGTPQWDYEDYFAGGLAYITEIENDFAAGSTEQTLITQAKSFLTTQSTAPFVTSNSASSIFGDPYAELLTDKIEAARTMVAEVQSWVLDLEQTGTGADQYDLFFDAEFGNDFIALENKWETYKAIVGPQMQSFFVPMIEFVEYGLLCARTASGSCDAALMMNNPNQLIAGNLPGYTASSQSLLLNKQAAFPKYFMEGQFDESESSSLERRFSFTKDVIVETIVGRAELKANNGVAPSITFSFTSALNGSDVPDITRIQLNIPKLVLRAKDSPDNFITTVFNGEEILVDMYGVKDATLPNDPRHYNIAALDFAGELKEGSGDTSDQLDLGINLISANPDKFYGPNVFPDLDVVIDAAAFKQYAQFGGVDLTNTKAAGFLTGPANVVDNEVLNGEVSYVQETDYSNLDSSLRELLQLTGVADFQMGSLQYSGGETAVVIWKVASSDTSYQARQCIRVDNLWACLPELPMSNLQCESSFGNDDATIAEVYAFLKDEGCIEQVQINGRGIYSVEYVDSNFVDGESYDVTLVKPYYLGLSSFSIRALTRFYEGDTPQPAALLNILGAAVDEDNISVAISLTHNYIGFSNSTSAGLYEIVPYGDRSIWFAMGRESNLDTEDDPDDTLSALVYYIQQGTVTLVMSGFDKTLNFSEADGPVGYLRYAGSTIGTLRKEGNVYVIRYADGSWQLL